MRHYMYKLISYHIVIALSLPYATKQYQQQFDIIIIKIELYEN